MPSASALNKGTPRTSSGSIFYAPGPSKDTTGVTDALAIQSLLDKAFARGGGTVQLQAAPGSAPYYVNKLRLDSNVMLQGVSRQGTVLAAPLGQNANRAIIAAFNLATSYGWGVRNLTVNGRNGASGARQQTNDFDGISLESSAGGTVMFGSFSMDYQALIENVAIVQASRYGLFISGRVAESRIRNVYVFNSGDAGFGLNASDIFLESCTAGGNGAEGFLAGISLSTGTAQFVNCKAFFNGNRTATRGDGFKLGSLTRGFSLDNCFAQDNYHDGFSVAGDGHRLRGIAAGNVNSHLSVRGLTDTDMDVTMSPNWNNVAAATYALDWAGTNSGCDVRLRGKASAFTTNTSAASTTGNTVQIRTTVLS